MNNEKHTSVELQINSNDYYINMFLIENDQKFVIELSDMYTADTWKGVFESSYIEELTMKTGNYKSFPIFVNMLRTALKRNSKVVTIELLTYNDLQILLSKKTNKSSNQPSLNFNSNNTNKRFLLLTYNVEFDRINYPLQLNYQGKSDINILLETIKKLKNVIKNYEAQNESKNTRELLKLDKENENDLELDSINSLKTDELNVKFQKESKLLRQMIKTIEEKSIKEKNLYQKQLLKKKQEIEYLKNELQQSKINERNLKNEIRTLSNELRVYRQRSTPKTKRSSSTESFRNNSLTRDDSFKFYQGHNSRASSRNSSRNSSLVNLNNNNNNNARIKSVSPVPSIRSTRSNQSTGSANRKKFNPTEYVKNKKSRLEEIEMKRKRELRNKMNGSKTSLNEKNFRTSNISLSDSEGCSYLSSDNQSDCNSISKRSDLSRRSKKSSNYQTKKNIPIQRESSRSKVIKNPKNSVNNNENLMDEFYNKNEELKEIDARLKSIQLLIQGHDDSN